MSRKLMLTRINTSRGDLPLWITRAVVAAIAGCSICATSPVEARLTKLVVTQTRSLGDGASMGSAGPYIRLDGTAFFEVDPRDSHNVVIVNLDKASRNTHGMVEFSSPFYMLKPVDSAKGNHKIYYGINNRGRQIEYAFRYAPNIPYVTGAELLTKGSLGDGLLLRLGYTYVDAGWQGDGIPGPGAIYPDFPIATNNGSPVIGPNRLEFQLPADAFSQPLVQGFKSYPPALPNSSSAALTVRDREGDPKVLISSDGWKFGTCPTGSSSLTPTLTDICLFSGFKADKIYELTYLAKDPIVMGLAYTVTRDMASFLRNQTEDDFGNPNPLRPKASDPQIRRIYASGSSSTAMYSREFLYLGFNADEMDRKVFDGFTLYAAGAHRLFANVQFSSPTFYSGQSQHQDYTSNSYPPFTFGVTTDPVSGIKDGILKRPATDPLVMQIDGGVEMWDWHASLNVTNGLGSPVAVPDNVRLYFLGSTQHANTGVGIFAPPAPTPACRYPTQAYYGNATLRALVVAMDRWVEDGIAPPPSRYPTIANKGLVTLAQYRALFPAIPGVPPTSVENTLNLLDFGPKFSSEGGLELRQPPTLGSSYQILHARPDIDGIDLRGVNQMEVRVPIGTNLGWNPRTGFRAPDICDLAGSFIPFTKTQAERLASGDARLSLEERYKTHEGFVTAVRHAAAQLVKEGLMLQEDADLYVRGAHESAVLQ